MKIYHNSFYMMGTRFNAVLLFSIEDVCAQLFSMMKNECHRIDIMLSYFNSQSKVCLINNQASKTPIKLDDELFKILETCCEYSKLTNGAFDITLRPVIEKLESNLDEKDSNILHSFMSEIKLDKDEETIEFTNEKVKIDFGGFGKGYALEKIKQILNESPVENALVSFGESSILAKGQHPAGMEWSIGIKDIYDDQNSLFNFHLQSGFSLSSSSNYYTDDAGQIRKKINVINPSTGKPIEDVAIVSVKSDSPMKAEILSTAFLVMEDKYIFETINKIGNVEAVKVIYDRKRPLVKTY
jgi:FAD:protein FMN transferase